MTQNALDLAKQGNPQAIAALMNRHLNPKGITVRASLKDDCLRIVLESEKVPDEQASASFVQKGLAALSSPAIARVKVFGQQIGDDIPAWSRDLELAGKLEPDISVHHAQPVETAVHCPKCSSTQIMASKKGFGVGKAAVGAVLLGPLGIAGGMMGSNQLLLSCMKCGHQWEPGKATASEDRLKHRVTPAKVKIMSMSERIGTSISAAFFCGLFGIALLGIPLIGWVAGFFLLIFAVAIPYWCITGNKDFISKLVGNCPHCDKPVEVNNINDKESNCSHCKKKFFIRERKFHTI